MTEAAESLSTENLLRALVGLAIAERAERLDPDAEPVKTEVLLADAGLTSKEIALLTGQKPKTVTQTIRRARAS